MSTSDPMTSPKDRFRRPTSPGVTAVLRSVVRERAVGPRHDILRQGEDPRIAHVLLDGHACRYRMLSDGRRQITAVVVPGEVCDLEAVLRGRADFNVGTLTGCVFGEIAAERIAPIDHIDRDMRAALLRQLLRDEAIAREWLVGLGRRTALERVAHLFCELWLRLRGVGLARDDGYDLKIRQGELADALGLSTVHINRVLQSLRRSGLIRWAEGSLSIVDFPALAQLAEFEPSYIDEI